jgi:ClpP class serine protease
MKTFGSTTMTSFGDILHGVQQCAVTFLVGAIGYATIKTVFYFTSSGDSKAQAIDSAKEAEWNCRQNILIGHQTTSQSLLKQVVDNRETSIDESTYVRVAARFEQIKAEFGEQSEIHIHIRTPGGQLFYATLIAHLVHQWKGKTTAHIHQFACSGGTLIAIACDSIVMQEDSVLGPIDPQMPKNSDMLSATQVLVATGVDPCAIDDNTRFASILPPPTATGQQSSFSSSEKNKVDDESSQFALKLTMLRAFETLKSFKTFLRRILSKNYQPDKCEEIIRFFWMDRTHSTPIFWRDCEQVGLRIVAPVQTMTELNSPSAALLNDKEN